MGVQVRSSLPRLGPAGEGLACGGAEDDGGQGGEGDRDHDHLVRGGQHLGAARHAHERGQAAVGRTARQHPAVIATGGAALVAAPELVAGPEFIAEASTFTVVAADSLLAVEACQGGWTDSCQSSAAIAAFVIATLGVRALAEGYFRANIVATDRPIDPSRVRRGLNSAAAGGGDWDKYRCGPHTVRQLGQ